MYLDKEAYERAGIVGKPHGVKGNRGLKPRWSALFLVFTPNTIGNTDQLCCFLVVEVDLNTSSMVPGKKGFDRLVYAARNALNTPLTWLFHNLAETGEFPFPKKLLSK